MLSWIAFWMDKRDTGNRLTVGVTTILTIMFLLGHSNSSVPKMSYVKAMDVYLLSSFAFIFFSLVETVLCWRFDSEQVELKEKKKVSALKRKYSTTIVTRDIVSGNAAKVIVLCFCSGLANMCSFTVTERSLHGFLYNEAIIQ